MTQQIIDTGSAANDGKGDPLQIAFEKANANFSELYAGSTQNCATIAALKSTAPPTGAASVFVGGYWVNGDGGGGPFYWDAISTAADDAATVIQPALGGVGRWKRILLAPAVVSPEMFGAKCDGSTLAAYNDAAAIDRASVYLLGLGGGTVIYGIRIYNLAYTLANAPNGISEVRLFSGVNHVGRGAGTKLRVADGVNTTNNFIYGLYSTNTLNNILIADLTVDMNGANNCGSGTLYGQNCATGALAGDNITVRNVRYQNNPGSNNIFFGQLQLVPAVTDIKITGTEHENCGDNVNPACTDHSSTYVVAQGATVTGNTFSQGPSTNGSAIELHGTGVTATGNSIDNYFNGAIVSNETTGGQLLTAGVVFSGNTLNNVKGGVQIACRSTATLADVIISDNTIVLNSSTGGLAIDATTLVDPGGQCLSLVVSNNTIRHSAGAKAAAYSGIAIGPWSNAVVSGNIVKGSLGYGVVLGPIYAADGCYIVEGNIIRDPGQTTTVSPDYKVGIQVNSPSNVASVNALVIRSNIIIGTMHYGINGTLPANTSQVQGNPISGASIANVQFSGANSVVGLTSTGTPNSSFAVADGIVTTL